MLANKVNIFNIVPPRASGSRGHKYGFAADMRLRVYQREAREIKRDMKTDNIRGWRASYKRWNKKDWEFQTAHRGKLYHVTVTAGEGGFIIVQRADTRNNEVVCCMMKMTKAYATTLYYYRDACEAEKLRHKNGS